MPEPNSVCNKLRFKKTQQTNTCCSTDLPELHADGTVQLHQTCLKMHGLAFRVVQVDGSALVVVTLDLTQMHPQVIAKLAELCFAGVLKAKLESCRKKTKTSYLSIWNWRYLILGGWDVKTNETLCHLAGQCHGTGAPPWSCFLADPGTDGKIPTRTSPMEWGAVGQYDPGCLLHSQHSGAHWNYFHGEKKDTWISI